MSTKYDNQNQNIHFYVTRVRDQIIPGFVYYIGHKYIIHRVPVTIITRVKNYTFSDSNIRKIILFRFFYGGDGISL